MRFRVPALDQSDCSICYNYDLNSSYNSATHNTITLCHNLVYHCQQEQWIAINHAQYGT